MWLCECQRIQHQPVAGRQRSRRAIFKSWVNCPFKPHRKICVAVRLWVRSRWDAVLSYITHPRTLLALLHDEEDVSHRRNTFTAAASRRSDCCVCWTMDEEKCENAVNLRLVPSSSALCADDGPRDPDFAPTIPQTAECQVYRQTVLLLCLESRSHRNANIAAVLGLLRASPGRRLAVKRRAKRRARLKIQTAPWIESHLRPGGALKSD